MNDIYEYIRRISKENGIDFVSSDFIRETSEMNKGAIRSGAIQNTTRFLNPNTKRITNQKFAYLYRGTKNNFQDIQLLETLSAELDSTYNLIEGTTSIILIHSDAITFAFRDSNGVNHYQFEMIIEYK